MGLIIPFVTFGIAVAALLAWGMKDKARRTGSRTPSAERPQRAA